MKAILPFVYTLHADSRTCDTDCVVCAERGGDGEWEDRHRVRDRLQSVPPDASGITLLDGALHRSRLTLTPLDGSIALSNNGSNHREGHDDDYCTRGNREDAGGTG